MSSSNPHDRFFKAVFTRPEAAADLVRQTLPPEVAACLDLSSIRPGKESFVDAGLREHYSDLLLEVHTRDAQPAPVYLLAEHKSHPDQWVALDLLRYAVEVWHHWRKGAGKGRRRLPPLIPLVLYHGEQHWCAPQEIADLLQAGGTLDRYRPRFCYELLDLSAVSDEQLPKQVHSRAALLALKYVFRPEMRVRVRDIVASLRVLSGKPGGLDYIRTVLNYLVIAARELEAEQLREAVEETFIEESDIMPTIAEQWIEHGKQQGMQQGMQQGAQQGEARMLQRQLTLRFGELPPEAIERIESADAELLLRWSERVLSAGSLEEVLH